MKKSYILTLVIILHASSVILAQNTKLIPDEYYSIKHFHVNGVSELNSIYSEPSGTFITSNDLYISEQSIDTTGQIDISDTLQSYINRAYQLNLVKGNFKVSRVFLPSGSFLLLKPIRLLDHVMVIGSDSGETVINCNVGDGNACFEMKPQQTEPTLVIPLDYNISKGATEIELPIDTLLKLEMITKSQGSTVLSNHISYLAISQIDTLNGNGFNKYVKEFYAPIISKASPDSSKIYLNFRLVNENINYHYYGYSPNHNNQHTVLHYDTNNHSEIQFYDWIIGAGLSCITLNRMDTLQNQGVDVLLQNALECSIRSIKCENNKGINLKLDNSIHNVIKRCNFSNNVNQTETIGILITNGSAHNSVFDNAIGNVSHGIVLENGANHNTLITNYIYGTDSSTNDSIETFTGNILIKGGFVFSNVLEFNKVDKIHFSETSGPYNILHRNYLTGDGIMMCESCFGDSLVFTGNEVVNDTGKLTINGSGHFIFGNKNVQEIVPDSSDTPLEKVITLRNFDENRFWGGGHQFIFNTYSDIVFGEPFNQPKKSIYAMKNFQNKPECIIQHIDIVYYPWSVEEITKPLQKFYSYPNPNDGEFRINLEGHLIIYDMQGKIIKEQIVSDISEIIRIERKGLYILKLIDSEQMIYNFKIIVY